MYSPPHVAAHDGVQEASIAWEKRQAAVRACVEEQESRAAWAKMWPDMAAPATGARMYANAQAARSRGCSAQGSATSSADEDAWGDAAAGGGGSGDGREGGRIADLAARAARASRLWKSMQALQRSRQALLVSVSSASESCDAA